MSLDLLKEEKDLDFDMTVYTSRPDGAVPGDIIYFWRTVGGGDARPKAPEGFTVFTPQNLVIGDWHWQWAFGVKIPKNALPGEYKVDDISFTVLRNRAKKNSPSPSRPRSWAWMSSRDHRNSFQSMLDSGYDLDLQPGMYRWDRSLLVPHGAKIRSAGAWIIREPNGEPNERVFKCLGDMTLEGIRLTHSEEIDSAKIFYFHHDYPQPPGYLTVRNCELYGGNLSESTSPGMVVEDCIFNRAGTGFISGGSVYRRCRFIGHTSVGHHAYFNAGAVGSLIVSCEWVNTNRGMVFQTGPAQGTVALDLQFHGIRGGETNANEVILFETGTNGQVPIGEGARENVFADIQITDCNGPGVSLYGSGISKNQFWNMNIDVDNLPITFTPLSGGKVDDHQFHNIQLSGPITLAGDVGKLYLGNIHFFRKPQKCGNQGAFKPNIEFFNKNFPFNIDDAAKKSITLTMLYCTQTSADGVVISFSDYRDYKYP